MTDSGSGGSRVLAGCRLNWFGPRPPTPTPKARGRTIRRPAPRRWRRDSWKMPSAASRWRASAPPAATGNDLDRRRQPEQSRRRAPRAGRHGGRDRAAATGACHSREARRSRAAPRSRQRSTASPASTRARRLQRRRAAAEARPRHPRKGSRRRRSPHRRRASTTSPCSTPPRAARATPSRSISAPSPSSRNTAPGRARHDARELRRPAQRDRPRSEKPSKMEHARQAIRADRRAPATATAVRRTAIQVPGRGTSSRRRSRTD